MSPEDFTKRVRQIRKEHAYAPERSHSLLDSLMEETLISHGYAKGIELIRRSPRWYE